MKYTRQIAIGATLFCTTLVIARWAVAQQEQSGSPSEPQDVFYFNQATPPPAGVAGGIRVEGVGPVVDQAVTQAMAGVGPIVSQAVGDAMTKAFTFVSAIGPGSGKLVTDAPYSAQAATETVQTLADGNRITHQSSSTLYRDSQGRTRRDQTLDAIGPFGAAANPPNLTFITDPVAQLQYVLDNNAKTAQETSLSTGDWGASASGARAGVLARTGTALSGGPQTMGDLPSLPPMPPPLPGGGQAVMFFRKFGENPLPPPGSAQPAPTTEDLGKQTIEGVECQGTRSTVTIAAGAIGNDLPIQIVSERWYSPDLQEVVLSTNSDPRVGKTTYRLTNISRNSPALSLFQVPAGYSVTQSPVVSASGFADCVAAGGTVKGGPLQQCTTADGKTYLDPPSLSGAGTNRAPSSKR